MTCCPISENFDVSCRLSKYCRIGLIFFVYRYGIGFDSYSMFDYQSIVIVTTVSVMVVLVAVVAGSQLVRGSRTFSIRAGYGRVATSYTRNRFFTTVSCGGVDVPSWCHSVPEIRCLGIRIYIQTLFTLPDIMV